jgi:hypothetical protein
VIQGRKFGPGFWSAGFAQHTAPYLNNNFGDSEGFTKVIVKSTVAAVIGGTTSALGGGKFENGAKTFGFLRLFGEAADYYQRKTGYAATLSPGENRPGRTRYVPDPVTGQQRHEDRTINPVGFNEELTGNFWADLGKQGSPLSKFLNVVPFIRATAGLHDFWFNVPGHPEQNFINNYGTMPAAAVISAGAVLGNFTQGWDSNPALTYYLTMPRE